MIYRSSRPRVIRKVVRMGKNEFPKFARDYKADIYMERVRARAPRTCAYPGCPVDRVIDKNEYYAKVGDGVKAYGGGRRFPVEKDYHFFCVPSEARPLNRFFGEMV